MAAASNHNVGEANLSEANLSETWPLTGCRVLLVEDSWHVAQGYKSLLEIAGLEVAGPAGTIADGQSLLAEQTPDLALVDINLHETMAYGLIDQLIACNVPTIVVSGYEVLPELNDQVAAVLTKPVRASVLLATVRRVITARRKPQ